MALTGLFLAAGPAMAQKSQTKVLYSNYCAAPTQAVAGWQQDLVSDNKGLGRYYWAPIKYGKHSQYVVTQTDKSSAVKTFHDLKPQRIPFAKPAQTPTKSASESMTTAASLRAPTAQATTMLSYSYDNHCAVEYTSARLAPRSSRSSSDKKAADGKNDNSKIRVAVATARLLKQ